MRIITIGGVPAAGKTYTSKLFAKKNNYLALEVEKLRWDFFNENLDKNLYRYTNPIKQINNESMRDYYLRCMLYEGNMTIDLMTKWHKATMEFIRKKMDVIIEEAKNIKNKTDYNYFCNKYSNLINYMPKYELLNKKFIIFSHAFINTIDFFESDRIRIDFKSDEETLITRFKNREKIKNNNFNNNLKKYYKSYDEVLKNSKAIVLDTNEAEIIEKISSLL